MAIGAQDRGLEWMGLTTNDGMVIEDEGGADGGVIVAVLVPDWEGGCADGTCSAGCDVRGVGSFKTRRE